MHFSEPVLSDPEDINIWDSIRRIGDKKNSKNKQEFVKLTEGLLEKKNKLHSAVVVDLIKGSVYFEIDDHCDLILKLITLKRDGEFYPLLEATDIIMKDGNTQIAASLMDRVGKAPDTAFIEYLKGLYSMKKGDQEGAVSHFINSNAIDPSFIRTYDALDSIDPWNGWDVLRNIALLKQNKNITKTKTTDVNLLELQDIYIEWSKGNIVEAGNRLRISNGLATRGFDFILASARMAHALEEYTKSLALYDELLQKYPNIGSLVIEKADLLSDSGYPKEALALLASSVKKADTKNRSMAEAKMRSLAALGDTHETVEFCKSFLNTEHADKNSFILVSKIYASLELYGESDRILDLLLTMYPRDYDIHITRTMNDLALGRNSQALKSAEKAISTQKKNPKGHYTKALALLKLGKIKAAKKSAETALKLSPDDLETLYVLADIYMDLSDYDYALRTSDHILDLEPKNARAFKISGQCLTNMNKNEEALDRYRNALNIKRSRKMFNDILAQLIRSNNYHDAVVIANEFIHMYEDTVESWRLKGNAEYGCDLFLEAFASFTNAVRLDPHDAVTWHSRGLSAEKAMKLDEAEISYDKSLMLDLDNPGYWLSKSIIQEKKGDFKGAVVSLNKTIYESPNNVFAMSKKAKILAMSGMNNEALFFLGHALKIEPENVRALSMRREILKHIKDYEKLIDVCETILKIDQNNVESVLDLVLAYQCLDKEEEAIKIMNSRTRNFSKMDLFMLKKRSAKVSGDLKMEIEICESILEMNPENKDMWIELADALVRNSEYDRAMEIYDELQKAEPNDVNIVLLKGELKSLMGDDAAAYALFNHAAVTYPNDCRALNDLATMLLRDNKKREAAEILDRAIMVNPTFAESYILKADILLDGGDRRGAIKVLTNGSEHIPINGELSYRIGNVHMMMGNYSASISMYDQAIMKGYEAGEVYYNRGCVYEKMGSKDAALNNYVISAIKDPKNVRCLERAGTLQYETGSMENADKNIDLALAIDVTDVASLLTKARIMTKVGDYPAAISFYKILCSKRDCDPAIVSEMDRVVSGSVEIDVPPAAEQYDADIDTIEDSKETEDVVVEQKIEEDIIDAAVALLENAYSSKRHLTDQKLISEIGIPRGKTEAVLNYISDIKEYVGDIDPKSSEFERMETLSKNLILGERMSDIESNPYVNMPTAYSSSRAESIDEVKRLVAYIHKALTFDMEPVMFSTEVKDASVKASKMSGDLGTYEIMKKFGLGVYSARTVSMYIKKGCAEDDALCI